jgi:hypothetical protein
VLRRLLGVAPEDAADQLAVPRRHRLLLDGLLSAAGGLLKRLLRLHGSCLAAAIDWRIAIPLGDHALGGGLPRRAAGIDRGGLGSFGRTRWDLCSGTGTVPDTIAALLLLLHLAGEPLELLALLRRQLFDHLLGLLAEALGLLAALLLALLALRHLLKLFHHPLHARALLLLLIAAS